MSLSIVLNSDEENHDNEFVRQSIREFNSDVVPKVFEYINLILKDESGKVCGGLLSKRLWNFIYVDILWIDETYRKYGYGKKLMDQIEEIAKSKDVNLIFLDTFGFQAPGFYKKCGYEVFGTLENCPAGYNRYYFKKAL